MDINLNLPVIKPPPRFILYGLQRSGTNIIEQLWNHNFDQKILMYEKSYDYPIHKHTRLFKKYDHTMFHSFDNDVKNCLHLPSNYSLHYIITIKDPYS